MIDFQLKGTKFGGKVRKIDGFWEDGIQDKIQTAISGNANDKSIGLEITKDLDYLDWIGFYFIFRGTYYEKNT